MSDVVSHMWDGNPLHERVSPIVKPVVGSMTEMPKTMVCPYCDKTFTLAEGHECAGKEVIV